MFISDYTKLPEQILLDLINNDNGTSFELGQLVFQAPTVRANDDGEPAHNNRLTTIRVAAAEGSGYANYVDMKYRRIHFRDVFELSNPDNAIEFPIASIPFDLAENTRLVDLIPTINQRYGLNLQATDFWDRALPVFEGPPPYANAYVRMEAKVESPVFVGGVRLRILPNDYPLDQRLPNNELSGLEYDNTTWMIPEAYPKLQTFLETKLSQPGYW